MNLFEIEIKTERLRLEPIELSHAEDCFKYMDNSVTTYMYPKPADDISETIAWINGARGKMKKGSNVQLVIINKTTGEFLGCAGLHEVDLKTPEFGVWTKKDSHGNGYGREAITAIYNWACSNIEFDYIIYPVDKRNIASRKIPESLGGIVKKEYKEKNMAGVELYLLDYHIYPKSIK